MSPRRIKISYSKVNIEQIVAWLELNKYKYALVPDPAAAESIKELTLFLELYTDEAEVATRIKWETE